MIVPVIRDRDHLSFRINFAVSAMVMAVWVLVLRDEGQTGWLLQRVVFLGGAAGFVLAPLIAGLGLSHALFGRARWFVMLAALAAGGQMFVSGYTEAVILTHIGALAAIFAWLPRVFGAISLIVAVRALADGVWPGLAVIMDGALPFLRIGDPGVEVVLALALGALPLVTRAAAARWG